LDIFIFPLFFCTLLFCTDQVGCEAGAFYVPDLSPLVPIRMLQAQSCTFAAAAMEDAQPEAMIIAGVGIGFARFFCSLDRSRRKQAGNRY
jgi:hypothetical protein